MLCIKELRTEYRQNPLGIDRANPRFSWILSSDQNDTVQQSYSVTVKCGEQTVWDSGELWEDCSVLVPYAGEALHPCTRYTVRLRVLDNHGGSAEARGWFETGLGEAERALPRWITHGYPDEAEPCPVFVRDFSLSAPVKAARLYASALGIYEAALNGERVGDAFFIPGWTSYRTRLQYQSYDITPLLREGGNRIEVSTAKGWYAGVLGFRGDSGLYGKRSSLWALLRIEYEDGRVETVQSDESWQYGTGPRRMAELYHGETIDHRHSLSLDGAAVLSGDAAPLPIAQECEAVRITGRRGPVDSFVTPKGEKVLDFGQNLVGVVEARLCCPAGTKVTLQHAEVLDKEGNFYTANLRSARATDSFICAGDGEELFMPSFTFHGFRYLKVEGLEEVEAERFTACVMHSDMEPIGSFSCSRPDVNRLWENIRWGQRGNFLDIPTDCPQRDERLGWTGDAQVFCSTAVFSYHCALFFSKWLRDLKAEQTMDFGVPFVIPNIQGNTDGSAAWGDAATVVPWTVYRAYGDKGVLEEQYDSMKGWVEFIRAKAGDRHLWQSGYHFGDWVSLDCEEGQRSGTTDIYLIASAFYAYSVRLTAKAAAALGKKEDAEYYTKLHEDIKAAFQREYITETGRMVSETQTACVLALHFDLAKPEHRARILRSLTENIARRKNHLSTGFVGTPYLCHTLSENGCHDLAGTLFLQKDFPSWLYAVDKGATTIWERWNSIRPDGNFDESGMNSFNHYAYGSIGSWMVEKLAGLNAAEPGYKHIHIAPMPIEGIDAAKAFLKTPYGTLSCGWRREQGRMTVDVTVPVNTSATVRLPGRDGEESLGSGTYRYEYETL